jgi:hypothetical protein
MLLLSVRFRGRKRGRMWHGFWGHFGDNTGRVNPLGLVPEMNGYEATRQLARRDAVGSPVRPHRNDPQGLAALQSRPLNILYVEDDRDLVLLVKERQTQAGFAVDVAYDGNDTIAKFAGGAYDLLAMDQTQLVTAFSGRRCQPRPSSSWSCLGVAHASRPLQSPLVPDALHLSPSPLTSDTSAELRQGCEARAWRGGGRRRDRRGENRAARCREAGSRRRLAPSAWQAKAE